MTIIRLALACPFLLGIYLCMRAAGFIGGKCVRDAIAKTIVSIGKGIAP